MSEEHQSIVIKDGTIVRIILWLFLAWLLYAIRDVVAVVLFSVVVASAIEPAAQWFKRHGVNRIIGVLITYFVAFTLIILLFSLIVPPLFNEISSLAVDVAMRPDAVFGGFIPELPFFISDVLQDLSESIQVVAANFSGGFFKAATTVFGGALSVILIIVFSFYLSLQEGGIEDFLAVVTPGRHEKYVLDLWRRSRRKIGRWFQGQILMAVLIGVLVYLGLSILQVRFALPLAVLSAMFEIIPIFGPIMAAIPGVFIAFVQSPILGLLTLGLYIVVQQFENHLVYPLVMRKTTGVHPAIVILALIVGGKLGGIFGLILAVPVASVLVEISNDIAARKHPVAGD